MVAVAWIRMHFEKNVFNLLILNWSKIHATWMFKFTLNVDDSSYLGKLFSMKSLALKLF